MGKLLDKRWIGDQLIAVVGMLVAAAMAALLGVVMLVAGQVDENASARERELVHAAVLALKAKTKSDLASFAAPDVGFELPSAQRVRWLYHHYGSRLYQAGRYNESYILDSAAQPIYSSVNGMLLKGMTDLDLDPKLLTLAREVHVNFQHANIIRKLLSADAGENLQPPPTSIFRSQFVRIHGRPALIAANVSAPIFARSNERVDAPPVVVVVSYFDRFTVRELETEVSVTGLRFSDSVEHPETQTGIAVAMDDGGEPLHVFWQASRPGTAILERIAPALGVITLFFGFVTLIVLRTMRASTQELAISERRAVEMAYRDPLTGLANRLRLVETLKKQIPGLAPGQKLALFFLDLDGFKDINDTLGHPVGDELLAMVGERLEGILGSKGMTVRFGGDEFAVLAPISQTEEIGRIAERIIETVRQPVAAGEHVLHVGVTLGVSLAPEHGSEPEELLRRADIALYKAKAEGRGSHRIFDPADETVLQNRRAIERDIERAMWHDEFFTLYQPLYSADGERLESVETLVRWQHPERGLVPPSDFIHVAEKSGLIMKLDEWVLRKACEHALRWPDISVAVNMSPSNFRHSNLAERVKRIVEETGFDPRRLEIEITEGMLLNANEEVLFDLQELREFGIRFAIDDFGTGYSSLGYLGSFPVDKIKIDQSFV
ncbi:MAG: putative bifunctional diguanylate cyclase/phosphodiesterase, partial [Xanthobacteraceae bacterium]